MPPRAPFRSLALVVVCAACAEAFAPASLPGLRARAPLAVGAAPLRGARCNRVKQAMQLSPEQQEAPLLVLQEVKPAGVGTGVRFVPLNTALIGTAVVVWATVLHRAFADGATITPSDVHACVRHLPSVFALIGFADVVAQVMRGAKFRHGDLFGAGSEMRFGAVPDPPSIDLKQSAQVGLVGSMVTGIGTDFWLHGLHSAFPAYTVGVDSPERLVHLVEKVVTDSAIWGTISNTLSISLRGAVRGKSPAEIAALWNARIIEVMRSEMLFWPLWGAMTFCTLPASHHVESYAVGNIFWQVYLSLVCRTPVGPVAPDGGAAGAAAPPGAAEDGAAAWETEALGDTAFSA